MVNAIPGLNLPVLNFTCPNREPTGLLMQMVNKTREHSENRRHAKGFGFGTVL